MKKKLHFFNGAKFYWRIRLQEISILLVGVGVEGEEVVARPHSDWGSDEERKERQARALPAAESVGWWTEWTPTFSKFPYFAFGRLARWKVKKLWFRQVYICWNKVIILVIFFWIVGTLFFFQFESRESEIEDCVNHYYSYLQHNIVRSKFSF